MFKRKGRLCIAVLLALTILMSSAMMTAYAQTDSTKSSSKDAVYIQNSTEKAIWLDGCDVNDITQIDAVRWYAEDNIFYFFMPTSADLSSLRMYTNFTDVKFNGVSVANDEIIDLTGENSAGVITADGNDYNYEVMQSSSVGTIFLTTESGSLDDVNASEDKSHRESGDIVVIDTDGTTVSYDNVLEYIKGRGNTTWQKDKKPYNIKLDEKADLMGMGTSKKWCLLANAQEHSMMRNKFSYDMANDLGMPFQAESRFTDIYANGEYLGSYQITEKVELGDNNLVDITNLEENTEDAVKAAGNDDDLESYSQYTDGSFGRAGYRQAVNIPNDPEDITGGYLIEAVWGIGEVSGFTSDRSQNIDLKSPEFASVAQINYIADFYQDMEDALFSETGYNEEGKHYSEYIDIDDAAKAYLLQEFCMNIDAGISSMFLFKDSDLTGDGKLHISPVWDFDVAYGNLDMSKDGVDLLDNQKMFVNQSKLSNTGGRTDTLLAALCNHDDFNELCIDIWQNEFVPAYKVFTGENEATGRLQSYDTYMSMLNDQAEMNYILWDLTNNLLVPEAGTTHDEHAEYLKDWMDGRYEFLNTVFTTVDIAKEAAINDLNAKFNSYNEGEYTAEDYQAMKDARDDGITNINNATTSNEVTQAKETAIAEIERIAGVIIYFDNSEVNWEEVYVYWWESSEKISWPGEKAELTADKSIAKISIPSDITTVVFSNGMPSGDGKEQTENIKLSNNELNKFVIDVDTMVYDEKKEANCYNGSWVKSQTANYPGDVNLNGKIDVGDALNIQIVIAKISTYSEEAMENADVDGNATINIADVIAVLKMLSKV